MAKAAKEETKNIPNLSSGAMFLGLSLLLILVAFIYIFSQSFSQTILTFGSCKLEADIARTDAEQARGLSGRAGIPKDYAMIFPYQQEQPFFWMKDMLT